MDDQQDAQVPGNRIAVLDREFARLHARSCTLIGLAPENLVYVNSTNQPSKRSIGECILRSAATVERTFGGITAKLWDDPFEWTLPEYLSGQHKIVEYLNEVESLRARAFISFGDDECLEKLVVLPSGESARLVELLEKTLSQATDLQREAAASLKSLSGISAPGFII